MADGLDTQAGASPRRPTRHRDLTLLFSRARRFSCPRVSSGESSSTNNTSHSSPRNASSRAATTRGMFSASLKVGTMTLSVGINSQVSGGWPRQAKESVEKAGRTGIGAQVIFADSQASIKPLARASIMGRNSGCSSRLDACTADTQVRPR